MTIVRFGNTAPIEHVEGPPENEGDEPQKVRTAIAIAEDADHAVTELRIPDDMPLVDALTAVTAPVRGAWDNHSDARPAWVSSDNDRIAELLAEHFSSEVEGDEHTCKVVAFEDDTPVGVTPPGDADEAPRARRGRRSSGDE